MTEKLKIEFAPGAFDDFEGTQEELAEMMADIQNMFENGTWQENARRLSPEEEEEFVKAMENRIPQLKQ
jgi:hypothetical protein